MATEEETTKVGPENLTANNGETNGKKITPVSNTNTPITLSAENPLGDNQYFFEDQVFFVNKAGRVKFGLVIETCDSYSGDEDDDEEQKLNRGDVRVAWYPLGREHVRSENTIGLADRTLMPGDVVRRMTAGCNPQRGYIRDIKISADVKILKTPYVIKNIAAERLRPLSIWQRDCTVCLDSWVGSAKDVDERAVLRGSNGVRFEIQSADFYHFKEATTSRRPSVFSPLIFFPGNIVTGRLPSLDKAKLLTPDIPLPLNRKGAMLKAKFAVESVRTEGVIVQWQCKALSKINTDVLELEPPKPYVNAEQLARVKRLNVFETCVLQIADRSFLTFEPKDQLITKSKWEKELAIRFKEMFRQQRLSALEKIKSKEQIKHDKEYKSNSNTKNSKHLSEKTSKVENGEWLTTTNTTDTSDISESEIDEIDDVESVTTNTGDDELTEHNQDGGAGASVKKQTSSKCLLKKSSSTRHKHQNHARQQASTNKWLHKNAIYVPMNMSSVREGKELITETLLVFSSVDVVWQDGTVETEIPSTQLYPIHHLDNHEFFPGDFTMLSREDPEITFRDYGVIQTVDHQGRTARVKWFKTYSPEDEAGAPTFKGESEVSVYDLKDHPDFTYRPGGMVIRVSNFIGDDASCTAGQVLDNCTDGRVKVAWDDGHTSCCWPQDLYDVGHHEQNDYGGDSDSWETQSENSNPGCYDELDDIPEPQSNENDVVVYMERALSAIAKFEEIITSNPQLQSRSVMRKLLHIYKTGRFIDRLMQTNFFHENYFLGLIKRVNQDQDLDGTLALNTTPSGDPNETQTSQDIELNLTELADELNTEKITPSANNECDKALKSPIPNSSINNFESPKVLLNLNFRHVGNSTNGNSSSPKSSNNSNTTATSRSCTYTPHIVHVRYTADTAQLGSKVLYASVPASEGEKLIEEEQTKLNDSLTPAQQQAMLLDVCNAEKNHLLSSALLSIEKAYQVTNNIKSNVETSQDDSGTFSRSNSDVGAAVDTEQLHALEREAEELVLMVSQKNKTTSDFDMAYQNEFMEQVSTNLICVPFCMILREQLQKCKEQIELKCEHKTIGLSTNTCAHLTKSNEAVEKTILEEERTELKKILTLDVDVDRNKKTKMENAPTVVPAAESNGTLVKPMSETWIVPEECFKIVANAPKSHKFYTSSCEPSQPQQYFRAVQREHRLLKSSLPKGIWLRFYEDRIDLLSVMMEGPKKTPYENGLYFFDLQLGRDYPKRPPVCHYISYCVDRLNPNLYEEGKVCVSLLGTWSGRDVEVWGSNSTLLQVLVSIQGLILVPEPYFNEAGYEKQKGSLQGFENSRMYNEMVVIKVAQATLKMLINPPEIFKSDILEYYKQHGLAMYERIKGWMELSKQYEKHEAVNENQGKRVESADAMDLTKPDFPLLPASRGFCLTLESLLKNLKDKMSVIANMVLSTDVETSSSAIEEPDQCANAPISSTKNDCNQS